MNQLIAVEKSSIYLRSSPRKRGPRGGKTRRLRGADGTLLWIGDGHPVCDPVAMLISAWRTIEAAAQRRGFDPNNPPHLSKVMRTL